MKAGGSEKMTELLLLITMSSYISTLGLTSEEVSLAINAYFEAREDGVDGMVGASTVVLKRYNHPHWPDTVEEVVVEASAYASKPWKCKFSWTCDDMPDVIDDEGALREAVKAAKIAISNYEYDITQDSYYYYRCELHLTQGWMYNVEFRTRIGSHCYYGDK